MLCKELEEWKWQEGGRIFTQHTAFNEKEHFHELVNLLPWCCLTMCAGWTLHTVMLCCWNVIIQFTRRIVWFVSQDAYSEAVLILVLLSTPAVLLKIKDEFRGFWPHTSAVNGQISTRPLLLFYYYILITVVKDFKCSEGINSWR